MTGLLVPVAGACLPELEPLLPNAPREYRAGIHEGIDLYDGVACVPLEKGTEVLAVAGGTVIRADRDFVEMTLEELDELLMRSQENGFTMEEDLDRFRGRQVWIDHGDGFISRYAHLVEVAPDLKVGDEIVAGQVIGGVGNSGTLEGVRDTDAPVHLHFEIRIGDSYLGEGLSHAEVLSLLRKVFTIRIPSPEVTCVVRLLPSPGLAQVITPGYKLIFDLAGTSYAVHTNSDGSHMVICEDGQ